MPTSRERISFNSRCRSDAILRELVGHGARQGREPGPQGRGDGQELHRLSAGKRRDVHDAAPPALPHRRQDEAAEPDDVEERRIDSLPPVRFGEIEQAAGGRTAAVGHENVHRAEGVNGLAMPVFDRLGPRQIAGRGEDLRSRSLRLDFASGAIEHPCVAPADRNAAAFARGFGALRLGTRHSFYMLFSRSAFSRASSIVPTM